ncbi:MAG: hypothetical protein WA673_17370, partial [Candidatus Acidiferrales bacterium]
RQVPGENHPEHCSGIRDSLLFLTLGEHGRGYRQTQSADHHSLFQGFYPYPAEMWSHLPYD